MLRVSRRLQRRGGICLTAATPRGDARARKQREAEAEEANAGDEA